MEILRWRCPNGHVLGLVEKRGNGRHVLLLFRYALEDLTPGSGEENSTREVEVMALVEGTMLEVRCSICGGVKSWWEDGGRRRTMGEGRPNKEAKDG